MQNLKVCCVRVSELVTGINFITWRSASHPAPHLLIEWRGVEESMKHKYKYTNTQISLDGVPATPLHTLELLIERRGGWRINGFFRKTQIQKHKYTNITWQCASQRSTLTHRMKGGWRISEIQGVSKKSYFSDFRFFSVLEIWFYFFTYDLEPACHYGLFLQ